VRAIVHIAGRPDPDCCQRCVICREVLVDRSCGGFGDWYPMGADVSQVVAVDAVSGYETSTITFQLGDGPPDAISVRCTAI
jgi:hypothetical protein